MIRFLAPVLGAVLAVLSLAGPSQALSPAAPGGASPILLVSNETKAARSQLDALKLELDQAEAALRREGITDPELQALRAKLDPIADTVGNFIADLTPRVEAAKVRLDQLGERPEEGQPPESPDVAAERSEREAALAEVSDTQRLGRTLLVQAEQIRAQITDRRRSAFTRALFARSSALVSPDLWVSVVTALPREWSALRTVASDWFYRVRRDAPAHAAIPVALAIAAAIGLYASRRRIAGRFVRRDISETAPPRRRRVLAALGVLAVGAVPAAAASFVLYAALDGVNLLPPRVEPVAGAVLAGLALVAFVHALADAVLAPHCGPWRLMVVDDAAAKRLAAFATAIAVSVAVGKSIETVNQAIAAVLPVTVATRGVFALIAAGLLADLLRRSARAAVVDEECLGPYVAPEATLGGPARILGWAAAAAIAVSAVVGYVALASFLVDQILWAAVVATLLFLAIALADELVEGTLKGETRVATALQANIGLRRRSLQQIGVLANGAVRVLLFAAAGLLVLAPWGLESADLLGSLRAAFFGFQVGDVTISLSSIIFAALIFGLGITATRTVQRWLDKTYLPATDLDAGLRNSILTAFGYLGFFIAGAIAFSYLGLSLDKIAIVAGALSVGIGFGLQSIVNNFVSGLILLWERPIRVGDLVVVGDGEGHVRRINVRATEIETFDRSTIVVPNSNLISGVVRNRVRSDRTGRVLVPISVMRYADPAQVETILTGLAKAHPDVLQQPPPRVFFKKIGDATLDFELMCFVVDVDYQARVLSDLNFRIFEAFTAEKIIPPPAMPQLDVRGLDPVGTALESIAGAIAQVGERRVEVPRSPKRTAAE